MRVDLGEQRDVPPLRLGLAQPASLFRWVRTRIWTPRPHVHDHETLSTVAPLPKSVASAPRRRGAGPDSLAHGSQSERDVGSIGCGSSPVASARAPSRRHTGSIIPLEIFTARRDRSILYIHTGDEIWDSERALRVGETIVSKARAIESSNARLAVTWLSRTLWDRPKSETGNVPEIYESETRHPANRYTVSSNAAAARSRRASPAARARARSDCGRPGGRRTRASACRRW